MTTKAVVGGIAALAVVATIGGATAVVANSDSTAINPALGAPPVEVYSVNESEVYVDYGPQQPGPFTPSEAKVKSLKVSWPRVIDTRHPTGITYTVLKNGKQIKTGLVDNFVTVGFTPKTTSFRFCVTAVNSVGKLSPTGCTTFSGR